MTEVSRPHARSLVIDAKVVADLFGVSTASIYTLGRKNELPFPAINIGRSVRFKRSDVEEFFGCTLDQTLEPEQSEAPTLAAVREQ